MLKYYFKTTEAWKRLRADDDGVVSFEYVIVAACIVATVGAAFGAGTGPVTDALIGALSAITTKLASAVS
jgi:pilus assembly protein Flp/PilA